MRLHTNDLIFPMTRIHCWCSFTQHSKDYHITPWRRSGEISYSPQITSWSLQRMRVLRQCTVPRAVMFVTTQRENIHPSKKEMNKLFTMLKLSDVCSQAMNHYVSLSLTNRKSSVHLHALYSPRTAVRTFTHRRDQLVICGQYDSSILTSELDGEWVVSVTPRPRFTLGEDKLWAI
jgi:hypothetical protein